MAKTKKSKAASIKRVRRGLLGLILRWSDNDPIADNADIYKTEVTHRNPMQRLICKEAWARNSEWITQTEFTWQLNVKVCYDTPNKAESKNKIDDATFTLTCGIRNFKDTRLDSAIEKFIVESRLSNTLLSDTDKNYGVYTHVEYDAEIVGV